MVRGFLLGTYVSRLDGYAGCLCSGEYVLRISVNLYTGVTCENLEDTVVGIVALDNNVGVSGNNEADNGILCKLCTAAMSLTRATDNEVVYALENACEVALSGRFAEHVFALCYGANDLDGDEIVIGKTGVNYGAILVCEIERSSVESLEAFIACLTDSEGSVLGISIRINLNKSTCLYREGNGTLNLDLAAVMSYGALDSYSGIALYCSESVLGGEVKNGVLGDLCRSIGILVGNGSGNALAAPSEDNCVLSCCILVNRACINCEVGNGDKGIVGIVSLADNAVKHDVLAYLVVGSEAFDLEVNELCCRGSLLTGIYDDGV